MNIQHTLDALAERLQATGVKTVFGEPVSVEGRTVIPVARVAYGFGSGGGHAGPPGDHAHTVSGGGGGGGGGVRAVPAGVIDITREGTRFVRFNDWRPLAAAGMIGFALGVVLSRCRDRRPRRQ